MRAGLRSGVVIWCVQLALLAAAACSDALQDPAAGNAGASGSGERAGSGDSTSRAGSRAGGGDGGDGGDAVNGGSGESAGDDGLGGAGAANGGSDSGGGGGEPNSSGTGGSAAGSAGSAGASGSSGAPVGGNAGTSGSAGTSGAGAGTGGSAGMSGGGAGGVSGVCSGTAQPCSEIPLDQCTKAPQCAAPAPCKSLPIGPAFCANLPQQTCTVTTGCIWIGDGPGLGCKLSPDYCPSLSSQSACQAAVVCSWSPICGNTANCSLLTSSTACGLQPGCSWH